MDRGAWWATIHGITKSLTRLSEFTSLHFTELQEEKGTTEDGMVGYHHQLKGMNLSKIWEIVEDREPGML